MPGRSDELIDDLAVEAPISAVRVPRVGRTFLRPGALLARTVIGQSYILNSDQVVNLPAAALTCRNFTSGILKAMGLLANLLHMNDASW
jgi:hypothetical protein